MSNLKSKTGLDENAPLLLRSNAKAVIHAPVDKIDIPEWLFTLTDAEYQQCSVAHIAGAATRTPDGKRMSINVEMVGPGLMIQHWVEDIAEKQHCRLVSLSDMFAQQERSKMQLAWDMGVKPLSASSCEFTNSLSVFGTDEFLAFVLKTDAPSEQLKKEVQRALDAHNAEETPNFARSIERRTLSTAVSSTVELARDALPT
jgi:hypothetical protein